MPRGGRRSGKPGKAYANRSDLTGTQPVRVAPSTSYGQGVAAERAQRAMPLPQSAGPGVAAAGVSAAPGPVPGALPLNRPTERPAEPLTAGMVMGAGPGPSALMPSVDPVIETLRAAARAFPNPAIFALLEGLEESGGR